MTTTNANLIARSQRDPAYFFEHILGWQPWSRQIDIALAVRDAIAGRGPKRIAIRSGNGVGKTAIAARIMLWALRCHRDSVVITTAPTTRQVTEILWREARDAYLAAHRPLGGTFYDGQARWDLGPRRFALGMSPENTRPERFQGFHASLIVFIVDEASGVPPAHWEAIKGSLLAGNAVLLAIGNPTRLSGEFYDAFHKNAALWRCLHISAFHSPNLMQSQENTTARPEPVEEHPHAMSPANETHPPGEHPERGELPLWQRDTGNVPPSLPSTLAGGSVGTTSPAEAERQHQPPPPLTGEGQGEGALTIPGLVTPEGVLQAAADWGEASPLYQVRILGQFPSQAGNQLISLEWIEQAASAERQHPGERPERGEVPLWQGDTGDVPPSPPSTLAGGGGGNNKSCRS